MAKNAPQHTAVRFTEDELTTLKRLANERQLSQAAVLRWALQCAVREHEREEALALRTFEWLRADVDFSDLKDLPDEEWTQRRNSDGDYIFTLGDYRFQLSEDKLPEREWHVARWAPDGTRVGVVEDRRVEWLGKVPREEALKQRDG